MADDISFARVSLASVFALALSACAAIGPDFHPPAAPGVATYSMAGDPGYGSITLSPNPGSEVPWWRALRSPKLDGVMELALAGNPSLVEAIATLERAKSQAEAAHAKLKPQAELNAGAKRERINAQAFGFVGFPSPTINLFSVGPSVSYDLDLFGGRRRAAESAHAQADRQAHQADAAYLSLTGNVALESLKIARLRSQLATLDAIIADDQTTIVMVGRAQSAGGEPPSAISGGQGQLARDEALRPPLQRDLALARHQLALLVGRAPGDWSAPDFDLADFHRPVTVPLEIPSSLVRHRPDILAAEAELHGATAKIGVAMADLYPNVRLSAGFTQSSVEPADLFRYNSTGWTLMSGLAAPLFDGGRLKAEKQAAQAEARAALARYQATVLRALVEVADAISDLTQDDLTLAALSRSEHAQASHLDDARQAFKLGGAPMIAVVDAQRELNRARRETLNAQARLQSDLVALLTASAAGRKTQTP